MNSKDSRRPLLRARVGFRARVAVLVVLGLLGFGGSFAFGGVSAITATTTTPLPDPPPTTTRRVPPPPPAPPPPPPPPPAYTPPPPPPPPPAYTPPPPPPPPAAVQQKPLTPPRRPKPAPKPKPLKRRPAKPPAIAEKRDRNDNAELAGNTTPRPPTASAGLAASATDPSSQVFPLLMTGALAAAMLLLGLGLAPAVLPPGRLDNFLYDRRVSLISGGLAIAAGAAVGLLIALGGS